MKPGASHVRFNGKGYGGFLEMAVAEFHRMICLANHGSVQV
jgi:hypothetical protein